MNFRSRQDAVRKTLSEANADWFLISDLFNIRYLSGFTGSHALIMLSGGRQILLTDGRYDEQVRQQAPDFEIVIQPRDQKEHETVAETMGDLSGASVWFEEEHVSYSKYKTWAEKMPAREYIGKTGVVEDVRAIKEEAEIEAMRDALHAAERAWGRAIEQLREGMTERELAHRLEHEMWVEGAEKESFDSLILFGERASLPHGRPSERKLKKGDVVLTDFGCLLGGYCSDITRTVFFGEPTAEMHKVYGLVRDAHLRAEEALAAGKTGKEIDAAARKVIEDAGYGDQFNHGLGHGVGLEIHEAPRLSVLNDKPLQAGAVVTNEPGIYLPGVGGVRLENMAVVRDGGCEVLNQTNIDMRIY
ncbi:MAG: M24 family metallopeptidase [bacterium]|nr:M24 family metallopeptidase [bacterium]